MNRKGPEIWLMVIFTFVFLLVIIVLSQKASAYTPHDPIEIDGDLDFSTQALDEGWPGNGTQDNPYILEGYEIEVGWGIGNNAIEIRKTDAHFVVRNSRITGEYRPHLIYFGNLRNGTLKNCIIENGSLGISLWAANQIKIINNTLINCDLLVRESYQCNFSQNRFINGGIEIGGIGLENWNSHYIDISNSVNGKPVYYAKNQNGGTIPNDPGQIILANCTNYKIENFKLTNISNGISLGFSSHNTIDQNIIKNCSEAGVNLWHSSENILSNNEISTCKLGIFFQHSDNNTIQFNKIFLNSWGMHLFHSNSNYIFGNNASNNRGDGIHIGSSHGHFKTQKNSIINNTINNCGLWGLKIEFVDGIEVLGNTISNNSIGIHLISSNNGTFHHNNLINNSNELKREDSFNVWRNSHGRGNFWSDYQGLDAIGNGVGDTNLPHQGVDYHPLMEPAKPGDYLKSDFDREPNSEPEDIFQCISLMFKLLIILMILLIFLKIKKNAS
jgi:parallel beta-helix repeat protein